MRALSIAALCAVVLLGATGCNNPEALAAFARGYNQSYNSTYAHQLQSQHRGTGTAQQPSVIDYQRSFDRSFDRGMQGVHAVANSRTQERQRQTTSPSELLLFGQSMGGQVFLGCLSCDKYDPESIWNEYGDYGSKYASESIWNEHGDYGSKYSDYSPWNPYGQNPPIIVDRDGNIYGQFTVNEYHEYQTDVDWVLDVLATLRRH